jgi:hypothetical protein
MVLETTVDDFWPQVSPLELEDHLLCFGFFGLGWHGGPK